MSRSIPLIEEVAQRQTREFINADPTDLILTRTPTVSDGAGGMTEGTPVILDPQTVRIVPLRRARPIVTQEGRELSVMRSLIGMPDLDIQVDDVFTTSEGSFVVVNVVREPSWQAEASVVMESG